MQSCVILELSCRPHLSLSASGLGVSHLLETIWFSQDSEEHTVCQGNGSRVLEKEECPTKAGFKEGRRNCQVSACGLIM